jgi:hypothetical protein
VAVYFVETSALAKRYIAERGSTWLRALLDPGTGCSIYIVRVTAIEMMAAITRRERGGSLAPTDATTTRQAFRRNLIHVWSKHSNRASPQRIRLNWRRSFGLHAAYPIMHTQHRYG